MIRVHTTGERTHPRRRWSLAVLLSVVALLAGACGAGTTENGAAPTPGEEITEATEPDGEAASGELTLYTSVPEGIIHQIRDDFEAATPDLSAEVFRASPGDVQARIATEQQAGQVQADLIWVAEPSAYEAYKQQELLATYAPPEDAPIPDEFVDPDGFYVAGRVINMIVAWNTAAHPDGLSDWSDLLEVERAIFPAPSSGAALAAIQGIRNQIDEGFWQTFADSGGTQVSSNGAARDALIGGEFGAAGVLDYMMRQAKADGSPVDFTYPESGTVVIPSPVAITADSGNPDAAKVFLDYILSEEGQQTVVELGSFYPARTDVSPPEGAPSLDELTVINVDWEQLVDDAAEIDAMWSELFG